MFKRKLVLYDLLEKKSFFLFGPRATGKTTLIEQTLHGARILDLLQSETYTSLLKNPSLLSEMVEDHDGIVVIDEIQKLPQLLDEVHRLIQKKGSKFLLAGSSARKLKHGGANLLAGRAWEARLFPLSWSEITKFDLLRYLNQGGLPDIYLSEFPSEELESYVSLYLQEEIKAEAVTRNVAAFAEFLDAVGLANGEEINFERFASDLQVSPSTLRNYFQILEDTLIGFRLPGYVKTVKRKATQRAKHYLFDVGVAKHLSRMGQVLSGSENFGKLFEHFILLEVRAYLSYSRKKLKMAYWRSTSKLEVDLIIGEKLAVEVKSTKMVLPKHMKGIRALKEEGLIEKYCIVSLDSNIRTTEDGVKIYPWKDFLELLWNGELV